MDLLWTRENDASHLCYIPFDFGFSSSTSQRNSFCVGSLPLLSTTNSSFTVFFFSFKRFHLRSHPRSVSATDSRQIRGLQGGASVKVCLFSAAGKQRCRSVFGLLLCTVSSTKGHLSLFFLLFFSLKKEKNSLLNVCHCFH